MPYFRSRIEYTVVGAPTRIHSVTAGIRLESIPPIRAYMLMLYSFLRSVHAPTPVSQVISINDVIINDGPDILLSRLSNDDIHGFVGWREGGGTGDSGPISIARFASRIADGSIRSHSTVDDIIMGLIPMDRLMEMVDEPGPDDVSLWGMPTGITVYAGTLGRKTPWRKDAVELLPDIIAGNLATASRLIRLGSHFVYGCVTFQPWHGLKDKPLAVWAAMQLIWLELMRTCGDVSDMTYAFARCAVTPYRCLKDSMASLKTWNRWATADATLPPAPSIGQFLEPMYTATVIQGRSFSCPRSIEWRSNRSIHGRNRLWYQGVQPLSSEFADTCMEDLKWTCKLI